MANLIGWLKKEVVAPVQRDVVAPIQRDVVQPIQRVAAPIQQAIQHPMQAPVLGGFLQADNSIIHTPQNLVKLATADFTNNNIARQNAINQMLPAAHAAQQIARFVPETAATLTHPISQFTYHPNSGIEKALFGSTPIQNIQKKVANNYDTHPNLRPIDRIGLAGLEGLGSVTQDLPIGLGAAKAAKVGVKVGVKGAKGLSEGTKDLAVPRATLHDQQVLKDYTDYLVGAKTPHMDELNKLISDVRDVGVKHGVDMSANMTRAQRIESANNILNQIGKQRQAALDTGAIGKNVKMPESNRPIASPELKDYYDAKIAELKSMDGHNMNVNKETNVRSSDNSPIYSELYAKNGRAPTNQDYVDYIHQENMAGRGVSYHDPQEIADYKQMLKQSSKPKPPMQKAAGEINNTVANIEAKTGRDMVATPSTLNKVPARKGVSPALPEGVPRKAGPSVRGGVKPAGKGTFPTEAEFNKMIPAVAGKKQYGAANFMTGKGKVPKPNIPTNKNPLSFKMSNPVAKDYAAGITDMQRVHSGIDAAASRAQLAVSKLSKNDKALFADARENPKLITKAEDPTKLQDAITKFGKLTDTAHAYDTAAGGKTAHVANYYRHVIDLSKPEDLAKFNSLAQKKGFTKDPFSYSGLNNQPRVFRTIKEAENAKFKVINKDPVKEIQDFANRAKGIVGNQALSRGVRIADAKSGPEASLTEKFKLSPGNYVDVSPEAAARLRGVEQLHHSTNPIIKTLRTINVGAKSTILSLGQFHTINIGALRAAPTLILKGHPQAAAKGIYGMFRSAFGSGYADRVIGKAIDDGTVDKAAQIGMPYGGRGYNTEGTFLKHGIGSKTVFGKQIPMMHDQVARSIIHDLEKDNVPLDSPAAREAGMAGANLMGELNKELQNVSPVWRKAMTEGMLAGQFTPSKFLQAYRAVSKGGVGGSYARANVAANVAATTAVIAGIGYITKQKSDNIKDMLLRALVDPGAATSATDNKGNNIKLRTPGTDTSDIAKLLGIKLVRNPNGHLGVSWKGLDASTAADFGRARLSPLLSAGLKVLTNTNYGGKSLYDPNAAIGAKVAQGATSVLTGDLPIGLQGVPQLNAVKSRLPGSVKAVLNAQSPGTNPLIKSIGSSFGLTPSTDMTTGKGLQTTQYFNALDAAKKGLNAHEADTLNKLTDSKKNPVTGAYETTPTVYDAPTKANELLQNPTVLQRLTAMNQSLQKQGQKIDPFFNLSPDQQQKALQIQRLDPQNPDKSQLVKQAGAWYQQLGNDQSAFFSSLPAGDPNRPKSPVQYVPPSQEAQSLANTYYGLTDAAQKSAFISANPSIQDAFNATANYDKAIRSARGLPELKGYPSASPNLQAQLDKYNTLDKAGRAAYAKANPAIYDYFQQVTQYGLQNDATQARYVGNNFTSKGAKDIVSLANDIKYNGGLTPSPGTPASLVDASTGLITPTGSSGTSGGSKAKKVAVPALKSIKFNAIKGPKLASIKAKKLSSPKFTTKKVQVAKLPKTRKLSISKLPKVA